MRGIEGAGKAGCWQIKQLIRQMLPNGLDHKIATNQSKRVEQKAKQWYQNFTTTAANSHAHTHKNPFCRKVKCEENHQSVHNHS